MGIFYSCKKCVRCYYPDSYYLTDTIPANDTTQYRTPEICESRRNIKALTAEINQLGGDCATSR